VSVKHDWATIRAEYCEGWDEKGRVRWPTLPELASKHSVSVLLVQQHSHKERWKELRKECVKNRSTKRQTERAKVLADEGAQFDTAALNEAREIVRLVTERRTLFERAGRNKKKPQPIDTLDLMRLAGTLRQAQHVGRVALGDEPSSDLPPPGAGLPPPPAGGSLRVIYEPAPAIAKRHRVEDGR
jgi:hypothetical protein